MSTTASGGVQSVRRAAALLRTLTRTPSDGARLKDLAETLSIDRTTAHRLLQTLVAEGLVEQDASSRRYHLGLEFFTLAAAASNRYDIRDVARNALVQLAKALGDTVFFSLRSVYDLVCVDAHPGSYPVKTLVMDVGARYPLGAGSAGIALLAPLPDDEIQDILAHNTARLQKFQGHGPERIAAAIQRFRDVGFAFDEGRAVGGVHSIAVPLPDRRGRPLTAITVAAPPERMALNRRALVAAAIQTEGGKVAEAMWRKPDAARHRSTWLAATDLPLRDR